MPPAVHVEEMNVGVKSGFDLRLAAGKCQMPAGGGRHAHVESLRSQPCRHRCDGRIGGAEACSILGRRQPPMILRRFWILLVEQKLTERPLLCRRLGKNDVEAAHAKRVRRLTGIEARLSELVQMPR
jgi:hypothetical protein